MISASRLSLRPYQTAAIDKLRAAYQRGRRAPCLIMPCGAGKTIVSAAIIAGCRRLNTRTWFVADRNTLIDQTVAKLAVAGVTDVRVIQADRDEGSPDALVTVASAQTLRLPKWADRLPDPSLIIWDECHGVVARTYEATLQRYPRARLLGLTATACRGDNRPLSVFDELVVGATIKELTALGHLAPPHVLRPPLGALRDGQIALDPVAAWQRHASGQRAALFCLTVDQAETYRADFIAAGISAETVTATTRSRADIIARFAAAQFQILISVGCLTQGWDDPGCSVAIVARKPKHIGLWIQICGRVLRPYAGKAEGLILDLQGAYHDLGMPDAEHEYSLTGKAISLVSKDSIRQCTECGSVFLAGPRLCPYCGAELPVRPMAMPKVAGVDLVGVDAPAARSVRPEYGGPVTRKQTRDEPCSACCNIIRRGDEYLWYRGARRAVHIRCPLPAVPARPEAGA